MVIAFSGSPAGVGHAKIGRRLRMVWLFRDHSFKQLDGFLASASVEIGQTEMVTGWNKRRVQCQRLLEQHYGLVEITSEKVTNAEVGRIFSVMWVKDCFRRSHKGSNSFILQPLGHIKQSQVVVGLTIFAGANSK